MNVPRAEVIGDPIEHSKSPLIHGFWLDKLGIPGTYGAVRVESGRIPDYLDGRRADPDWRGCNVTIPHKETMALLCDALDPRTAAIGAVNTVVAQGGGRLLGTNTDIDGIAAAADGIDLRGRRVALIGAGGAARAALAFLGKQGCGRISVLARNPAKAENAARECRAKIAALRFQPRSGAFQEAALVINATQLGMEGQEPMPQFVLDELRTVASDARVFDMVYAPLETQLLAAARGRGLDAADGLVMLIGQAAKAFERFFDREAPRQHDDELRTLLTS